MHPVSTLAEEFLKAQWKSYGLVELKRQRSQDPEEAARRVDVITQLLFQMDQDSKLRAVDILSDWLRGNRDHPMWRPLQLRFVLYLHTLRRYPLAETELKPLLELEPESPALNNLQGNLLAYNRKDEEALSYFDRAVALEPTWIEPVLEKLERLIVSGQAHAALREVEENLTRRGNDERVHIILMAMRVAARVLAEVAYGQPNYPERVTEMDAARTMFIPDAHRETWKFDAISVHLTKEPSLDTEVKLEVNRWLEEIQRKITP